MQCVENCNDPNPAKHVAYEQPVWQTLQMFSESSPYLNMFHILNQFPSWGNALLVIFSYSRRWRLMFARFSARSVYLGKDPRATSGISVDREQGRAWRDPDDGMEGFVILATGCLWSHCHHCRLCCFCMNATNHLVVDEHWSLIHTSLHLSNDPWCTRSLCWCI